MAADADGLLAPADLPLLGEVAYAAGHLDVTIEAWERAHAACHAGRRPARRPPAQRCASRMHLLFDTALMAPVRGWLARAERLLDGARRDAGARVVRRRPHLRADAGRRPRRPPATWARQAVDDRLDVRPRRGGHRPGRRGPAAHPRRRRRGRVWRCSTRPAWPPSPASSTRSPPGSSTASSCARCRASPSTTWPSSGPRRWSGGARRTPSAASTGAAGCTAPRSSGCAGRAPRRRTRRCWPARSCVPTCAASSGGR